MGTGFNFKIAATNEYQTTRADVAVATEILDDADNTFSLYKLNSEISRIARSELAWEDSSLAQQEIKKQVALWQERTESFFTPYSPNGTYDPSGLVKTWATTNAAIYLEANGYRDFTINAGGDVYLGPDVRIPLLTRVGLSNLKPIRAQDAGVNMIVDLAGGKFRGVATSGSSERGNHIWLDAQNESNYVQVTVVAQDLITADVWATALVSGGKRALELFQQNFPNGEAVAVVISASGAIESTPGFAPLLAAI